MSELSHRTLSRLLAKNSYFDKRLVICRNNDEAVFLNSWISASEKKQDLPPAGGDVMHVKEQADLNLFVRNCSKCGASLEKKTGVGSGKNGVIIILYAPGLVGKMEMQFYKKESADMLKRITAAMNLSFGECYITNMIKCESDDLFMKPSQMLSNCLSVLETELALVKPELALVMGDIRPLQKIVNNSEIFWFAFEHPISMIKNPDLKRAAWETIKNINLKMKELGIV
ncbi:MAG: hypothetical protein FWG92_08085 [Leptospirales bacterium]|nr:hypothetical protein [Leptospirales bacterium]